MWTFFWLTVVGGFLKWSYATFVKDDVNYLDHVSLVYSIVLFIVLLINQPENNQDEIPIGDSIEINNNSELRKIKEKDKEWRESFGTGILDSN